MGFRVVSIRANMSARRLHRRHPLSLPSNNADEIAFFEIVFSEKKTPPIAQVCEAGLGAAVTSVAIDDRRQSCRRSSQKINHGGWETNICTDTPDEFEGNEDVPSAGAVIFCGDTKGNIQCFLEEPRSEGCMDGGRDEEAPAVGRVGEGRNAQPCLVLKRQHGKDQVGSLASCRQDTRQGSTAIKC